jgi:hypothetical protein
MVSTAINPRTFGAPAVGTVSVQVAPVNPSRSGLLVYNPGGTVNLWICAGDTTAAPNGAGCLLVPPGQGHNLNGWTQSVNAIAESGGANPITVQEYL